MIYRQVCRKCSWVTAPNPPPSLGWIQWKKADPFLVCPICDSDIGRQFPYDVVWENQSEWPPLEIAFFELLFLTSQLPTGIVDPLARVKLGKEFIELLEEIDFNGPDSPLYQL